MNIAIIGAGWAGLAAAVEASRSGHKAIVFEASNTIGGRARALNCTLPDGRPVVLDNGQHILIGAYAETLRLMQCVGVDPGKALMRLPLTLQFPGGLGLRFPNWPAPLDALAGVLAARGWSVADKWSLLRATLGWRLNAFQCSAQVCVAQLCQDLTPRVMAQLIEPLCVSALNTPIAEASAQVFLRVMKDALFDVAGGSNLLLPRVDLSKLFPHAAAHWLGQHGGELHCATRVEALHRHGLQWVVNGAVFDAVVLATPAWEAIRILEESAASAPEPIASSMRTWIHAASNLRFEAITTVYAWGPLAALPEPMLTLRGASAGQAEPSPAQFVFDRGQLGGPTGLLAFVVSASHGDRAMLQAQVLTQARQQLGLSLQAVQTVVEKRATFACTVGLRRPDHHVTSGLAVCGDYVAGPYPATLEGAVRSASIALKITGQEGARE